MLRRGYRLVVAELSGMNAFLLSKGAQGVYQGINI